MFRKLKRAWFRFWNISLCPHPCSRGRIKIQVLGHEMEMHSRMCPACSEVYLNKHATLCGTCEEPICPGMSVGKAEVGSSYPYAHLTPECSDSAANWCGYWGEGRLVTLHEIDPKSFPVPGVTTPVDILMSPKDEIEK